MKKIILFMLLIFLLIQNAYASQHGSIKLLAVSTDGNESIGSVADLTLEIKKGDGRVFIDTFPLTKLDTQFSTRFAKSVACDYLDYDCSNYDFFYTIKANSAIVGGPSAGAAITLLTISVLSNKKVPNNFAVTGTINSGGIIGPVAGIKEKIAAAKSEGLTNVIIPKLTFDNASELDDYLNNLTGIKVTKASTIDEALFLMTGDAKPFENEIYIDQTFLNIMKQISEVLCEETRGLFDNIENKTLANHSNDLYEKAMIAFDNQTYYSAASYCFGASLKLQELIFSDKTNDELFEIYLNLSEDITYLNNVVDSLDIATIADLQTYMIVKERLVESEKYINEISGFNNFTNLSSARLAYSVERYKSALAWSNFFGSGHKTYEINNEQLKQACINKIEEARTFLNYISYYVPIKLNGIEEELDYAYDDMKTGNYELCIFEASKAKAQSSLIIESISINQDQLKELLDDKIEIAQRNIARTQKKDIFPILGYSYFEYAKSLKDHDPNSALLYIGYSSELSNLNVYFEKKNRFNLNFIDFSQVFPFIIGFICGIIITVLIMPYAVSKRPIKKRR